MEDEETRNGEGGGGGEGRGQEEGWTMNKEKKQETRKRKQDTFKVLLSCHFVAQNKADWIVTDLVLQVRLH